MAPSLSKTRVKLRSEQDRGKMSAPEREVAGPDALAESSGPAINTLVLGENNAASAINITVRVFL